MNPAILRACAIRLPIFIAIGSLLREVLGSFFVICKKYSCINRFADYTCAPLWGVKSPPLSFQETTVSGINSHIARSPATLATRLADVCAHPAQVLFALELNAFAHRDEDKRGMN